MGVSCGIDIESNRGFHRAGQLVTGILGYTIDKLTDYQTATLSLIGKAKCKWTTYSGRYWSYTSYGHETFLALHLDILDKRPGVIMTLPVGEYEFPFQFTLPYEIPPSFQGEYGNIEYHLVVRFEKLSLFNSTKKFERTITIYGNVNPTVPIEPVSYEIRKRLYRMCSNKEHVVYIRAQITKSLLMPGKNAKVQLTVRNDTDTTIDYVSAKLVSKHSYRITGFDRNKKIIERKFYSLMDVTPSIPRYTISEFTCTVPTLPELYSIQHCKTIKIEYFIKVTASLSFPHTNPSVNMPIVIRDVRFEESSGINIEFDNFDETNDGHNIVPIVDSPPWAPRNEDNSEEESQEKN